MFMKTGRDSLKLASYAAMLMLSLFLTAHFFLQARISHRTFDQFSASRTIERDMPIGFVVRRFNIPEETVFKELNLPINRWNRRYTIGQACQKSKLDCQTVIDALNKKISE